MEALTPKKEENATKRHNWKDNCIAGDIRRPVF